MALDGITTFAIVSELKAALLGGRIDKIHQPLADEIRMSVRGNGAPKKLLLSANSGHPRIHLTESSRENPMTAPLFCMVLRKYIAGGKIVDILQPDFERIVILKIESANEMGDITQKSLILEIMGKHSNIIFCDSEGTIIDSIKHVSAAVSSLREVLPGKAYFIAATQDKLDALSTDGEAFRNALSARPQPVFKALYGSFTGISPVLAQELCYEAGIDADLPTAALGDSDYEGLYGAFSRMAEAIRQERFSPNIAYTKGNPVEFSALPLTLYAGGPLSGDSTVPYDSMSELLEHYYAEKNTLTRIRQKSADLRRIVQTALERNVKKYDLQLRQIKDTEKRETYRLYGELLHTYGYHALPGAKSLEAVNYYTGEPVTIPLDPTLTAAENATKYFDKYGKLKRTCEALSSLTQEVKSEIDHLESISAALDIALHEEDLAQIKEELTESGYIRRKGNAKKQKITSRPYHYISSDGFHMYVGKNNYQNDELTFKFATGNDWWFHAKQMPGSHVIVKLENAEELPDRTFEEAARLAAYYSRGRGHDKVEIDYIQKKHVKKPGGAKPGFVVYYTNYSMAIDSDISGIQLVSG